MLALALLAVPLLAAGCGVEEELDVPEGEPLELGEMAFNVQITRFLNPNIPGDSTYLEGAPPLRGDQQYLAVFMQVENHGEEPNVVPYPMRVEDTRGTVYTQADVDNPFALIPGTPVEPGETIPAPNTVAADGPIEGLMVLFLVEESATENRPLELEVPGPGEVGTIELDI